jgi:hypothetical protein
MVSHAISLALRSGPARELQKTRAWSAQVRSVSISTASRSSAKAWRNFRPTVRSAAVPRGSGIFSQSARSSAFSVTAESASSPLVLPFSWVLPFLPSLPSATRWAN